jgi:hypothetical protein
MLKPLTKSLTVAPTLLSILDLPFSWFDIEMVFLPFLYLPLFLRVDNYFIAKFDQRLNFIMVWAIRLFLSQCGKMPLNILEAS